MMPRPRVLFEAGDLEESSSLVAELYALGVDLVPRLGPDEAAEGQAPPDLAILGGALGEGRVGALSLRIRERWPRLPLVLVSPGLQETARPTPACRIIPPDARLLREAVEELLPRLVDDRPLVLCVDDDVRLLRALSRLIRRHGYRVAAFPCADRALAWLPCGAPDVAILDLRMPGLDGWTLLREIGRREEGRVPVILLTGLDEDEDIARGYREGASYYLTKPFEPRRVLDILDYLVGDLDPRRREELEARL
ncbi:MAG TPA: response regulator [Planctomycetota bacterium]